MKWNHRASFWDFRNLRKVTSGDWVYRPARRRGCDQVTGLSTDSRTIAPGEMFLALTGEMFDGHDFLGDAIRRGATMLIVEREDAVDRLGSVEIPVLQVEDCRASLLRLGSAYRKTLRKACVIGVTGSNGKTTTVRLIDAVMKSAKRGTASLKSFNNDIGVPLTILRAKPDDEYLVCEVGTNAPGEIAPLAAALEPDIGVVTSIGRAHIGNFASQQDLIEEKFSLLTHIRRGGAAVVPVELLDQSPVLKTVPRVITFGEAESADFRLTDYELVAPSEGQRAVSRFEVNGSMRFEIPMAGRHNARNALAAIAVGLEAGLSEQNIRAGLAAAQPPAMRFEPRLVAGVSIINDAYNASPESMRASIETFAAISGGASRRVLILGDMLELGDDAPSLHSEIGHFVLERCPADLIVTVGPMSLFLADVLLKSWPSGRVAIHSDLNADSASKIAARLRPGDMVLIKGSRRIGLERVVESLQKLEAGRGVARAAG